MRLGLQLGPRLRASEEAFFWWCPACLILHPILVDEVEWNENAQLPSIAPPEGFIYHNWANGRRCHYVLEEGCVSYRRTSTHALAGLRLRMPDLPLPFMDPAGRC